MVQVNERMLDWADIVFVMDDEQAEALRQSFPAHPASDNAIVLHIEDDYHFLDPELVQLLRDRATPHLDRLRAGAAHSRSPKPN
jgi:predicted protein tyrosine phosphatase